MRENEGFVAGARMADGPSVQQQAHRPARQANKLVFKVDHCLIRLPALRSFEPAGFDFSRQIMLLPTASAHTLRMPTNPRTHTHTRTNSLSIKIESTKTSR